MSKSSASKTSRVLSSFMTVCLLTTACGVDADTGSVDEPETWSAAAPHEPQAGDLQQKISSFRLNGGLVPETFDGDLPFSTFDSDTLITLTRIALQQNRVPEERINLLISLYGSTSFQEKMNSDPDTGRLLITTVSHSNDVVREVSEAVFSLLSENVNRLVITDDFPPNGTGSSSFTQTDLTVFTRAGLFQGSNGEDLRGEWFNEASEISYLLSGITPPSQNAQILQIILQLLYNMHDYRAFLDEENSGSIPNIGIRDNLASVFLNLYRPGAEQEAALGGKYFKHPDSLVPTDNPNTPGFNESQVNTMHELIERFRDTLYSSLPDTPDQEVPQWFADQYRVLTGLEMPNGNIADNAAIELAIEVCNRFLDERQDDRIFIRNYYEVVF